MFSNLKVYRKTHKIVEHKTENAIFIGLWQHGHGTDDTTEHIVRDALPSGLEEDAPAQ